MVHLSGRKEEKGGGRFGALLLQGGGTEGVALSKAYTISRKKRRASTGAKTPLKKRGKKRGKEGRD